MFHRELSHDTTIFIRREYYCQGFDKYDFHLILPASRKTIQAENTDNIIGADVVVNFGSEANN
jgi:hypothetical protein